MPLPSKQAVYSNALKGCTICCSGLSKEKKEDLYTKALYMGATVQRHLTNDVTHLVCPNSNSEKCRAFIKLKKVLTLPDWIHHAWKLQSQSKDGKSWVLLCFSF